MSLAERVSHLWYRGSRLAASPLLPLAGLFACVTALRRLGFRQGWLESQHPGVPVIVIGNITVGGTGKTPLVVWLCNLLRKEGYRPGIVSRGYGGKCPFYPSEVHLDSDPGEVGDEPLMLRYRTRCPVVVSPKRPVGARYLVEQLGCDVIISDDGLQHYALERDLEIVVLDGQRRLGNGLRIPAGPMREGRARLQTVDFIVINNGDARRNELAMGLQPGEFRDASGSGQVLPLEELIAMPSVALAGIGNPERFFDTIKTLGITPEQTLGFPDHHKFERAELEALRTTPGTALLMTEKDAVKCSHFDLPNCWYLPVSAILPEGFGQSIINKLSKLPY